MCIHIKCAKGGKDRIVPISENLLNLLYEYYFKYENNQCSDFLYQKLVATDNKYLIFYELVTNLKAFVNKLHDHKSAGISESKSPTLKLFTVHKWKEIQENILDRTKDKLLEKTVEYSLAAAPVAFVALSTIFK
jgi:hypothetical protein